jgi:hypothetical protein
MARKNKRRFANVFAAAFVTLSLGLHGCGETGVGSSIYWKYGDILIESRSFAIEAGGKTFNADVDEFTMSGGGDPPTELEMTWIEHDVEMRLFIHLDSDGAEWWSDEIRTYDGSDCDSSCWLYYQGDYFRSAVGKPFWGDFVVNSTSADNQGASGKIRFLDMKFEAY